jgi:hypothetical protein
MCRGKGGSRKPLSVQRVGRPGKHKGVGSLEMGSALCPWSRWRLPSLPRTLPGRVVLTVGNGFPVVADDGRRFVVRAELALPHLLEGPQAGAGGPVAAPAVANVQLDPAGRQEFPVPLDQLAGRRPVQVQQPLLPGCGGPSSLLGRTGPTVVAVRASRATAPDRRTWAHPIVCFARPNDGRSAAPAVAR